MTTLADLYLARLRALTPGWQEHYREGIPADLAVAIERSGPEYVAEWFGFEPALVRLVGAWVR